MDTIVKVEGLHKAYGATVAVEDVSFEMVWWALPVTALMLAAYFFLPGFFYLALAVLGGGGMIALGLYIRVRW